LPDKAIDLMDEAGACVKLRQSALPEEMVNLQKKIKSVIQRMQDAITNHEFDKARSYSEEERKEREELQRLREKYNVDERGRGTVTRQDIEEVLTRWTGISIEAEGTPLPFSE
jgi:ATP-dependent Clp protease ATP-binding subunit ClpC